MADTLPGHLTHLLASDPHAADWSCLKDEAPATVEILIEALEDKKHRAHLEALSKGPLRKDLRKLAGKAAYRLKSAGVDSTWKPPSSLSLARHEDELHTVGAAMMPGLMGTYMWLLKDLRPQFGVYGRTEVGGEIVDAKPMEGVALGRIKRYVKETLQKEQDIRVHLIDGDFAVQLLNRLERELEWRGDSEPIGWAAATFWRDTAIKRGASALKVDARTVLAEELASITPDLQRTTHLLMESQTLPRLIAPHGVYQSLEARIHQAVHSPLEIAKTAFRQRLDDMLNQTTDEWLAGELERKLMGSWLDANADFVLRNGHREQALQLLWLSDQIRKSDVVPHQVEFFKKIVALPMDEELAWSVYNEMKGEDHHNHGPLLVPPGDLRQP